MLYRIFLTLITALFVTMWTLHIRSELQLGSNRLRMVPLENVLREVFKNERPSQLIIRDGGQQIGSLRLSSRGEPPDGTHGLEFYGSVQFNIPGANLHRTSWSGELLLTPTWEMDTFKLTTATRDVTQKPNLATQLDFELSAPTQTASYTLKNEGRIVSQQTFTTDEAGITGMLEGIGVDQTWRQQLHLGAAPKPVITARQASLMVEHVKLETFLISIVINGQTLLEAHVSQLGEILQARTLFGWTLDVR